MLNSYDELIERKQKENPSAILDYENLADEIMKDNVSDTNKNNNVKTNNLTLEEEPTKK